MNKENSLTDIRWDKNKERLPFEQTIEVVVYTLSSHVPVFYRTFPGNTPDSRSLETILLDLEHAGFSDKYSFSCVHASALRFLFERGVDKKRM